MDRPLVEQLQSTVTKNGFEAHQFKVGWYNDVVPERFHLPYNYDTLAIMLLSVPDMFELHFIPFLKTLEWTADSKDPLDQSIVKYVSLLKETVLKDVDVEVYYDYEMDPRTRRPRLLMQTAGHVSAAAYFYQQHHVTHLLPPNAKKLYPVSIHPAYGGWFAFRTVLVVRDNHLPSHLSLTLPADTVPLDRDRLTLLELFNNHWKDSRYRNINNPQKTYSSIQQQYFIIAPKDRSTVLQQILDKS